ncbi:MAG: hypothetical protein ACFHHU_17850 [Porticoccaceae bacterium]|uniref:hypothetical protein n=1 Tax=Thalassospira sp. TaxID=1912094 RepID=UPI003A89F08E
MSKNKVILGGIAVVAVAAIGAHFAAPSFFEGRFRDHLTTPGSGLGGTFDNFELSLFGRTMLATDISLRDSNGVDYTAKIIRLENVNWLTMLDANPFDNILAEIVTVDSGNVQIGGQLISSSATSLGNLRISSAPDGLAYAVDHGEITGLELDISPESAATADSVAFEDLDPTKVGKVAIQNVRYTDPSQDRTLSLETMAADNCVATSLMPANIVKPQTPIETCDAVSGTGVAIDLDNMKQIKAATFAINQLSKAGVDAANFTGLQFIESETAVTSLGEIDIKGLEQSLQRDAFNDDTRIDDREWQHLIDNFAVEHLSIRDVLIESDDDAGKLDSLTVDGLKAGDLAKLAMSGIEIKIKDDKVNPKLALGNFEVSKLSLNLLHRIFNTAGIDPKVDPEDQMAKFMTQPIGETGVLMSPLVYEAFVFSDISFTGNSDPDNQFMFGIERANGSLGEPVRLSGSNMTFAKKAYTAYNGAYFEVSDTSPLKPLLSKILGVEEFDRITLQGEGSISWDEAEGTYEYSLKDTTIDNVGGISISIKVGNLTRDVMSELLATRMNETEKLQTIGLTQIGFDGARFEIKGEKLVKLFLRAIAQSSGQSVEELQMIGAITLMQTQQNFAQFPQLSGNIGELANWINDPQHLVISMSPDQVVPFSVIAAGGLQPDTAAKLVGLTIQANDNVK